MELSAICQIFSALTGMTAEETLEHLDLIRLSMEEIKSSLRVGVNPDEHARVLCYAAAATAFYRYSVLAANTGGVQSVESGETTIDTNSTSAIETAEAIRNEFLALAAPLMIDKQFGFRAV